MTRKELYETLSSIADSLPDHKREEFVNLVLWLTGTYDSKVIQRWLIDTGYIPKIGT
jgi:hypothetical protein